MNKFGYLLAGAAIGAVVTALFTPDRGEDLRARLKLLLQKRGLLPSDNIDEFVDMLATEIEEQSASGK